MNIFNFKKDLKKEIVKDTIDPVKALEARIFSEKKKEEGGYTSIFSSMWIWDYGHKPKTLEETITDNHKDFLELDRKFDALERYLQIEYFKEDTETQVYDWANKEHKEGFRKAPKKYEEMKAEKTKLNESCDCR